MSDERVRLVVRIPEDVLYRLDVASHELVLGRNLIVEQALVELLDSLEKTATRSTPVKTGTFR